MEDRRIDREPSSHAEMVGAVLREQPVFYVPLDRPHVNRVLIGVNLAFFAASFLIGLIVFRIWTGPVDLRVLFLLGLKANQRILDGEIWRLLTATFIHIGPTHLISNLIGLFMLGPIIEGHFGHWRYLFIYIVSGLMGSVASYAFSPALSAGASGAVFGLLGATLFYFYRFRENFGRRGREILQAVVVVLVLNIVFGLVDQNVDNWGHLGGLIGGTLASWGLTPRYRMPAAPDPSMLSSGRVALERSPRLAADLVWVGLCVAALVGAFFLATWAGPPLN